MSRHNAPKFLGVHAAPATVLRMVMALLPFIIVSLFYVAASEIRHQQNAQDKLLPTVGQMTRTVYRMAFTRDKRKDQFLMLQDTVASLTRLAIGVTLAAILGLLLGLNIAIYPGLNALLQSSLNFFSMIPPLAVLPILFVTVGLGEMSKIVLIVFGISPLIARDIILAATKIPPQQITKALTLGASHFAIAYRIVLPQIIPRLLDSVRLSLGAAWLFLIAAEAIAAEYGLGYRIFLVRRFFAMDVIIPYVLWITLLGYAFDYLLRKFIRRVFPWYHRAGDRI